MLGGIEAGGTKFVCVVGTSPDRIVPEARFPTRYPAVTIADAIGFFLDAAAGGHHIDALGVASFGPLDLAASTRVGLITTTPKPGWSGTDLLGPLRAALGVPDRASTPTSTAPPSARAAGAPPAACAPSSTSRSGRASAAAPSSTARPCTGCRTPRWGTSRHPAPGDDFAGICPFHGDCLEGIASGPAIAARWGRPAEELAGAAWRAPWRRGALPRRGSERRLPARPRADRPGRRRRRAAGAAAGVRARLPPRSAGTPGCRTTPRTRSSCRPASAARPVPRGPWCWRRPRPPPTAAMWRRGVRS